MKKLFSVLLMLILVQLPARAQAVSLELFCGDGTALTCDGINDYTLRGVALPILGESRSKSSTIRPPGSPLKLPKEPYCPQQLLSIQTSIQTILHRRSLLPQGVPLRPATGPGPLQQ